MAGVVKQIIGSFEDIGKDIARETAKIPTDVAGKALESLGSSSTKGQQSTKAPSEKSTLELLGLGGGKSSQKTPLDTLNDSQDPEAKKVIARRALEYLATRKQKEPSVWEKIQQETQQKKDAAAQQKAVARASELPKMSSKRKRGDMFGVNAKKTAAENRSVRQD